MRFIDTVLEPPSYGWTEAAGNLSKPAPSVIEKEFFPRLDILKNNKDWLPFTSWLMVAVLGFFLVMFISRYFSLKLLAIALVYSMVVMGSHGQCGIRVTILTGLSNSATIFRAFTAEPPTKNNPEEMYVISHHVNHNKPEEPGDPYNANDGFLYCCLTDVKHQPINRNMGMEQYFRCVKLMRHRGQITNSYKQLFFEDGFIYFSKSSYWPKNYFLI